MGLLNGLKNFDITNVKKGMSDKAKKGIAALKKSMGNLEGNELVQALKLKS